MAGLTSCIKFKHKPTMFPAFLSLMTTNLLDANGVAMIKETTVEGRDLSSHLKDSTVAKKNLFVSGITRQMSGGVQNIPFVPHVKKNLVVYNANAICPRARYLIQSGEMWSRHGKLFLILKFQQRTQFGICLLSNHPSYSSSSSCRSSSSSCRSSSSSCRKRHCANGC
jgi:hypothetical protein